MALFCRTGPGHPFSRPGIRPRFLKVKIGTGSLLRLGLRYRNLDLSWLGAACKLETMRIRLFILGGLALLLAGLSLSPALLATPPGPDAAVARLNHAGYRDRRHCTAVLTAPDRVLTAAHCLNGVHVEDLHLLRGYDRGDWLEHLRPTGAGGRDPSRDIVTLCLGHDDSRPFVPVAKRPVERGETVTVLGYGRPRVQILNENSCRITRIRPDGSFILDCPLPKGTSGGPVFRTNGSNREVVGIVSQTSETASLIFPPGKTATCGR